MFKFLNKGPEVQNRHDIGELASAINSFKNRFKVDYLPSRILLREDLNYAVVNPPMNAAQLLENDSAQFLQRMWPRLRGPVDWSGDGVPNGPWLLEGDQCLVFFLGGIPVSSGGVLGTEGFSTNPAVPAAPGGEPVAPPGEQAGDEEVPPPGTREGGNPEGPPAYHEQPPK